VISGQKTTTSDFDRTFLKSTLHY